MIFLIGISSFFAVVLATTALLSTASQGQEQLVERLEGLSSRVRAGTAAPATPLLRSQTYSTLPFLQRMLQGTTRAERISLSLQRAGLHWTVGQFILLSVGLAFCLAFPALLFVPVDPL